MSNKTRSKDYISSEIAIQFTKVCKKYEIYHEKPTFVEKFVKGRNETFWILKDINLIIQKGEKVGIIGPNGSGKTTLLKIITGITQVNRGNVRVSGRIASMLELDAGFNPELSGRENLRLNGMLMGMRKSQIEPKIPEIIDFSGIGKFIDAPFHTYSQGMKFRLAFSVAIKGEFDILIMDEVFVSGDLEFQKKSIDAIQKLQQVRNITTIVCSHIPGFVWVLANTFYKINKSNISKITPQEIQKDVGKMDAYWQEKIIASRPSY